MMRARARILGLLAGAAAALAFSLALALPAPAHATGPEVSIASGAPAQVFSANTTKLAFGGYEWWVIGDSIDGVNPGDGTVTLLIANTGDEASFKKDIGSGVPFRAGVYQRTPGYTGYMMRPSGYYSVYFADNTPGFEPWSMPYDYAGSTLQWQMEKAASALEVKYPYEYDLVKPRNFAAGGKYPDLSVDGIAGQKVDDQRLWALSLDEFSTLGSEQRKFSVSWRYPMSPPQPYWLRSAEGEKVYYSNAGSHPKLFASSVMQDGTLRGIPVEYPTWDRFPITNYAIVRPAMTLDTTRIMFTSEVGGKSSTFGNVSEVLEPSYDAKLKFTLVSNSMQFRVNNWQHEPGSELAIEYVNRQGGYNQYVTCTFNDPDTDEVYYYERIGHSAYPGHSTENLDVSEIPDGTYRLKIFAEQESEGNESDYCSEPYYLMLDVADGVGTLSEDPAYQPHEHIWGKPEFMWSKDGDECTLVFTCHYAGCSQKKYQNSGPELTASTPATCTEPGTATYTMTTEFEGETYTSTNTVEMEAALGHDAQQVEAVAATETEPGNITYWRCERCGLLFADEQLTQEITAEQTIVPATGTKGDDGKKDNDEKGDTDDGKDTGNGNGTATATPKPTTSPAPTKKQTGGSPLVATGDVAPYAIAGLAAAATASVACIAAARRKRTE